MSVKFGIKSARLAFVASAMILTGEAPSQEQTASPVVPADFCYRLASNVGLDKPAAPDGHTFWRAKALNFVHRFVVGGSSATGLAVRPVEPATVEDYKRLDDMCMPEGKGAVCKLVGPVNFNFTWKGKKTTTPVNAGERATVRVVGITATCQTEEP